MQFQQCGITVSVDDDELRRLVLERLNARSEVLELAIPTTPAIGAEWASQGGIYAGLARGHDDSPDYHLIIGPEYDGQLEWRHAAEWAATLDVHGFTDFSLPARKEQALCFANVPELFKAECYWSSEQHESDSGYAWGQGFDDGRQDYWGKLGKLRARAVRRLAIQ